MQHKGTLTRGGGAGEVRQSRQKTEGAAHDIDEGTARLTPTVVHVDVQVP